MIGGCLTSLGFVEDFAELRNLGFEIDLVAVELGLQLIKLLSFGSLADDSLLIVRLKSL